MRIKLFNDAGSSRAWPGAMDQRHSPLQGAQHRLLNAIQLRAGGCDQQQANLSCRCSKRCKFEISWGMTNSCWLSRVRLRSVGNVQSTSGKLDNPQSLKGTPGAVVDESEKVSRCLHSVPLR